MRTPPTTTVTIPWIGPLRLSRPQLAFVGGVTLLGALGVLEWPIALVLGAGHVLAADRSDPAVRETGRALEEA